MWGKLVEGQGNAGWERGLGFSFDALTRSFQLLLQLTLASAAAALPVLLECPAGPVDFAMSPGTQEATVSLVNTESRARLGLAGPNATCNGTGLDCRVVLSPLLGEQMVATAAGLAVNWTLGNSSGQASGDHCSFVVRAVDREPPRLECSGPVFVGSAVGAGAQAVPILAPELLQDNVAVTELGSTPALFVAGMTTTATVRAADAAGNVATCQLNVTLCQAGRYGQDCVLACAECGAAGCSSAGDCLVAPPVGPAACATPRPGYGGLQLTGQVAVPSLDFLSDPRTEGAVRRRLAELLHGGNETAKTSVWYGTAAPVAAPGPYNSSSNSSNSSNSLARAFLHNVTACRVLPLEQVDAVLAGLQPGFEPTASLPGSAVLSLARVSGLYGPATLPCTAPMPRASLSGDEISCLPCTGNASVRCEPQPLHLARFALPPLRYPDLTQERIVRLLLDIADAVQPLRRPASPNDAFFAVDLSRNASLAADAVVADVFTDDAEWASAVGLAVAQQRLVVNVSDGGVAIVATWPLSTAPPLSATPTTPSLAATSSTSSSSSSSSAATATATTTTTTTTTTMTSVAAANTTTSATTTTATSATTAAATADSPSPSSTTTTATATTPSTASSVTSTAPRAANAKSSSSGFITGSLGADVAIITLAVLLVLLILLCWICRMRARPRKSRSDRKRRDDAFPEPEEHQAVTACFANPVFEHPALVLAPTQDEPVDMQSMSLSPVDATISDMDAGMFGMVETPGVVMLGAQAAEEASDAAGVQRQPTGRRQRVAMRRRSSRLNDSEEDEPEDSGASSQSRRQQHQQQQQQEQQRQQQAQRDEEQIISPTPRPVAAAPATGTLDTKLLLLDSEAFFQSLNYEYEEHDETEI